ncbi:hypothetical protein [Phenylobacterium sp.]|uniref:hypothetical protein n=1 Tax=Phenylobacterium sp. TaxID=1871053 RepID=UPI0025E09F15|nr:hypothetical protein [Phenylobacterium sp.]
MSKGSYRGGSTSVGWNANRYVAPSLTGRTRKGKALIKDLTARTAQSRTEQAGQDERARKRHGLTPAKTKPAAQPSAVSSGKSGLADAARKRLKAKAASAFTVTVVKRKRPKPRA